MHATPDSELKATDFGFDLAVIDQLDPFHPSASVNCVPALLKCAPTAVQALADVQDTADNAGSGPFGFGVDSIDQLDPFHTSARVRSLFELSK